MLMCECQAPFPHGRPPTAVRAGSSAETAHAVDTVVVEERGHYAVDIVVVFADGVVRKRIDTHRTTTYDHSSCITDRF